MPSFVWTLQQRRAHNDLRDDWSDAVQTALLLGEQYVSLSFPSPTFSLFLSV